MTGGDDAPIRRAFTENDTLTFSVLNPDELQERFHHFGIDIKKIDKLPVEIAALLDSHMRRLEEQTVKRLSDIGSEIGRTNDTLNKARESPPSQEVSDALRDLLAGNKEIMCRLEKIEARLAEFE